MATDAMETTLERTVPPAFALRERPVEHPLPPSFIEHRAERDFHLKAPMDRCWAWLEAPETFSEGQLWPYRVEYLSPDGVTSPGFHEGGLTIHYGPLLCLPGRLDTIRRTSGRAYRSLEYLYGSYAFSLRLVRPTRLEFWVDRETESRTRISLRLSSDVHPMFATPWGRLQSSFWARFPRWMSRSLDAPLI